MADSITTAASLTRPPTCDQSPSTSCASSSSTCDNFYNGSLPAIIHGHSGQYAPSRKGKEIMIHSEAVRGGEAEEEILVGRLYYSFGNNESDAFIGDTALSDETMVYQAIGTLKPPPAITHNDINSLVGIESINTSSLTPLSISSRSNLLLSLPQLRITNSDSSSFPPPQIPTSSSSSTRAAELSQPLDIEHTIPSIVANSTRLRALTGGSTRSLDRTDIWGTSHVPSWNAELNQVPSSGYESRSIGSKWKDNANKRLHKLFSKINTSLDLVVLEECDIRSQRLRSHSAPMFISVPPSSHSTFDSEYTTALSTPIVDPDECVNYFDRLPYEMKLKVISSIKIVCQEDLEKLKRDGKWRMTGKWVGEVQGFREIIKVGRCSKAWRVLSLDGQHWSILSSTLGIPLLSNETFLSLVHSAGRFTRIFDFEGMRDMRDIILIKAIDVLAVGSDSMPLLLTELNLTGCTSLTNKSICHLLARSPLLRKINLAYLASVTAETIKIIGSTCEMLLELNVNRCKSLGAWGLMALKPSMETDDGIEGYKGIEVLRASSLPGLRDEVWQAISNQYSRSLVVLDLSFSSGLTNAAFSQGITFPQLRHLILSGCRGLTDESMTFLSASLPKIQYLELARMRMQSTQVRPIGLIKLFKRICVTLERIDLEDGTHLTDEVLVALIPDNRTRDLIDPWREKAKDLKIEEGVTRLELVILSSCPTLTDAGIRLLIKSSPRLRRLEADSTKVNETTLLGLIDQIVTAPGSNNGKVEAVVSVLDSRTVGLQATNPTTTRTRSGNRHYAFHPFLYHDSTLRGSLTRNTEEAGGGSSLEECDSNKVVVRSWLANLVVDEADASKRKERGGEKGYRSQCLVS